MIWSQKKNPEQEQEKLVNEILIGFEDITAYNKATNLCRAVFLERREQYGSHIENSKRFPELHKSGLYEKSARFIQNCENDECFKKDTLIDIINFGLFLLSESMDND